MPGGIGAAEAALSAGLIAMGVDESTAFAIAITQRLCTFYLPPIWGYFSLRWLERRATSEERCRRRAGEIEEQTSGDERFRLFVSMDAGDACGGAQRYVGFLFL